MPKFRSDIEGLRAVAVLLVLLFHAGLPVHGGYIGVDVFFVISGYLITGLLIREAETEGRISLLNFYARRARRLLPAATLVLLVTLGCTVALAPVTDAPIFAKDVAAAALYVVNWRFAARSVDYLAESVGRSPVLHYWSLAVEEQFYLLWPWIIAGTMALAQRSRRNQRAALFFSLSSVLLASFAWSVYFTAESSAEAFLVTPTRLWELGIGALLVLAKPSKAAELSKWMLNTLALLGVGLIVGSAFFVNANSAWPGALALAPTLGAALIIATGSMPTSTLVARMLSWPPLVTFGGLSYSIYLWHWPLLVVGQDWLNFHGAWWVMLLVLGSLALAWASYRFVEQPCRSSALLSRRSVNALGVGAFLSLITAVCGVGLASPDKVDRNPSSDAASNEQERDNLGIALLPQQGFVIAKPTNLGAGALGGSSAIELAGEPRQHYNAIIPSPADAEQDVPIAYAKGCQASFRDTSPRWCEIGARNADKRWVVAGDSKILQYYDAIDAAGKALGYRVSVATKSSCAFTRALTQRRSEPYPECKEFTESIIRELKQRPADAVLVSHAAMVGYLPGQRPVPSHGGMVQGLIELWSEL